jgi:hypothetical protein
MKQAVLCIRDVYPGSEYFHPECASKNLNILTQEKWFLSSRKYDPGCSSRIRIQIFFTHPGSRCQKGTGSATLETAIPFLHLGLLGELSSFVLLARD